MHPTHALFFLLVYKNIFKSILDAVGLLVCNSTSSMDYLLSSMTLSGQGYGDTVGPSCLQGPHSAC